MNNEKLEYNIIKITYEEGYPTLEINKDSESIFLRFNRCSDKYGMHPETWHVDACFWELMNPFRLSIDFDFDTIKEYEENVYQSHLVHDDFELICTCKDKYVLASFIEFVITPKTPSKEMFIKEINRLYKVLHGKEKQLLEIQNEIRVLEKRFELERY